MTKESKMLNFPISLLSGFMSAEPVTWEILKILCWGAYKYGGADDDNDYKRFMGGATYLGIAEAIRDFEVSPCYSIALGLDYNSSTPKTGISVNLLLDWLYNGMQKTDRERLTFLAFAAVKSMFADGKAVFPTNDKFFFARMAGLPKAIKTDEELPLDIFEYYKNHRDWRKKLMDDLALNYGLKYYSTRGIRGFYLSFKLSIPKLVEYVLQDTRKKKLQKIEREKKEAERQFQLNNS